MFGQYNIIISNIKLQYQTAHETIMKYIVDKYQHHSPFDNSILVGKLELEPETLDQMD